jgi:hypothetical protein
MCVYYFRFPVIFKENLLVILHYASCMVLLYFTPVYTNSAVGEHVSIAPLQVHENEVFKNPNMTEVK